MNLRLAATLLLSYACTLLPAQEKLPVYTPGANVTLPQLIPPNLSAITTQSCDQKTTGEAELSFLVDPAGKPHHIQFLHFIGNNFDYLALVLVRANRFHPALLNGAPVAAGLTVTINIHGCVITETDASGKKSQQMRLFAPPEQQFSPWNDAPKEATFDPPAAEQTLQPVRIGGRVHPPVPLFVPEASFSPQARMNHIEGKCFVSVIVSPEGLPESPRPVGKSIGYGLDEQAIDAVMRYRFKPAMKDGKPVPVYLTIAVDFRFRQ